MRTAYYLFTITIAIILLGQPWPTAKNATREHERIEVMATPVWISSNGDWGNTASWSTGSVPVSSDLVIFDGISSNRSVTGGLNQTGVNLAELQISPAYTGNIGLTGNPLVIDSLKVLHRGSGTLYWKAETDATRIRIDSPNLIAAAVLSGSSSGWRLAVKKGHVTCDDTVNNIRELRIMRDNAIVFVEKNGSTQIDSFVMTAGFCENNRGITGDDGTGVTRQAVVSGGLFVHQEGAVDFLRILGGNVEWNASELLGSALVGSGVLDLTKTGNAKQINELEIFPGADVFLTTQTAVGNTFDYREDIP